MPSLLPITPDDFDALTAQTKLAPRTVAYALLGLRCHASTRTAVQAAREQQLRSAEPGAGTVGDSPRH